MLDPHGTSAETMMQNTVESTGALNHATCIPIRYAVGHTCPHDPVHELHNREIACYGTIVTMQGLPAGVKDPAPGPDSSVRSAHKFRPIFGLSVLKTDFYPLSLAEALHIAP